MNQADKVAAEYDTGLGYGYASVMGTAEREVAQYMRKHSFLSCTADLFNGTVKRAVSGLTWEIVRTKTNGNLLPDELK